MTSSASSSPPQQQQQVVHPSSLEGLIKLRQAGLIRHTTVEDEANQHQCSAWGAAVRFETADDTTTTADDKTEGAVVVHVDFGGCRLRKGLPEGTLQVLREHFTLTSINLGGTDLPIRETIHVLDLFSPRLQSLYLGANNLCDGGAEQLGAWLVTARHLQTLDLRYNEIGPVGCEALCSGLEQQQQQCRNNNETTNNNSSLTKLYLEGNRISDQGAMCLGHWLSSTTDDQSPPLQELFVGANQIGPKGAAALAKCLVKNKTLCKIYLEGNKISLEGAEALTKVLIECQGNTGLKHLFCDNNGIGKEGSEGLANALNSATAIGGSLLD